MTAPKWYDLTLSEEKCRERGIENVEQVGTLLENLGADRYVIGREIGEGGYQHYQVRVVFKTEKDTNHLISVFAGIGRVTPTHVRNFNYCEKEGNFYRSWEKVLNKFANLTLKVWQGQLISELSDQNEREITVVVDDNGNHGKTWLAKYMQVNHIAQYVPPLAEAQDFMAFAMEKPSKGYCFDLPRAETDKQKKGMWSAVEQIKNGYLYDKRYSYRDLWIQPPKMVVFTNEMPPTEMLSKDRWRIFTIDDRWGVETLERIANSD